MTAARVLDLLRDRGMTLAVAESLTGGLLTDAFVQVPGASAVLVGGVVAYATPVKSSVLGVDAALLRIEGPVHPSVATAMADGVRRALAVDGRPADAGVATTGVAGPDPQDGVAVGTVFIGVSVMNRLIARRFAFSGNRAAIRADATAAAIDLLSEALG